LVWWSCPLEMYYFIQIHLFILHALKCSFSGGIRRGSNCNILENQGEYVHRGIYMASSQRGRKLRLNYQRKRRLVQKLLFGYLCWNVLFCTLRSKEKAYHNEHFCRRSGQRSRVRKLQYIADLERTVDSLQVILWPCMLYIYVEF
jgi:hypothetical protein